MNEGEDFDTNLADDAFADENPEEDPFPDDPELADQPASNGSSNSGAFGAVFRAFTRTAIPVSPEQRDSLMRGIQQNIPIPNLSDGPPAEGFPAVDNGDPFGDDEDPFGGNEDPFGSGKAATSEDDDPFGGDDEEMTEDDDPFGGDDAEMTEDDDPFGGDDADDPFGGDDEDPFGN